MGLFSKITKGIGKAVSSVTKVAGKVIKTAAPVAALIPGVGTLASVAGSVIGNVLDPVKEQAIYEAVDDQGTVLVHKIENTVLENNPNIDAGTLQVATQAITNNALANTPTAKVDDSQSLTNIDTMTKIVQWCKSNFLIIGGAVLGFLFLTKGGKGRRRRY